MTFLADKPINELPLLPSQNDVWEQDLKHKEDEIQKVNH